MDRLFSVGSMSVDPWPDQSAFGRPIRYQSGVTLFERGDQVETLFLIDEGFVKLTIPDQDGSDLIVGLRTSGWLLGSASAVLGRSPADDSSNHLSQSSASARRGSVHCASGAVVGFKCLVASDAGA